MNEENRQPVSEVLETETRIDPRDIHAEVIGELRKEKIGKPTLALEMLALFMLVLIALPAINGMFYDETSKLYKIFHDTTPVKNPTTPTEKEEFLNGGVEQLIASSTTMKFENLVIKRLIASGTTIDCVMYSYNGVINLDEEPLYLEVYSSSEQLIASIKLTGTLDYQETEKTLTAAGLSFNNTLKYFAKVVRMTEGMYPNLDLVQNEEGIGTVTCSLDQRQIKYSFKNGYLINISDTETIGYDSYPTNEEYLTVLKQYRTKATNIGDELANVEETSTGFTFRATMDFESGYRLPNTITDYNYYAGDTEAKIIHYAQSGKGFDCR